MGYYVCDVIAPNHLYRLRIRSRPIVKKTSLLHCTLFTITIFIVIHDTASYIDKYGLHYYNKAGNKRQAEITAVQAEFTAAQAEVSGRVHQNRPRSRKAEITSNGQNTDIFGLIIFNETEFWCD